MDEIFDHISYCKGGSIIRMLVNYLGEEAFRKGIMLRRWKMCQLISCLSQEWFRT